MSRGVGLPNGEAEPLATSLSDLARREERLEG
jgi:hypothetical protein